MHFRGRHLLGQLITQLATILEDLLIEFINGIAGICVFEPDLTAGNLAVNGA